MDLFDIKQMTESFMEFKGFDIRTEKGRKEAIKWLEKTDGIDMFYTDAQDYNEGEDLFDKTIGAMRKSMMLEYLMDKENFKG